MGYGLFYVKHRGILTYFETEVKEKMGYFSAEIAKIAEKDLFGGWGRGGINVGISLTLCQCEGTIPDYSGGIS